MSDSTAQPDYFLHLDLGDGDLESHVHADGANFLDFTDSHPDHQENQGSTAPHDLTTASQQASWPEDHHDITKVPNQGSTGGQPTFAGLIPESHGSNGDHWGAEAHPSFASLMDMEIQQQLSPPEQTSGYITPDLIFAPNTSVLAPEDTTSTTVVEESETSSPATAQEAETSTTTASKRVTRKSPTSAPKTPEITPRTRRSSSSQVSKDLPESVPVATDVRRSGRARKPTALATMSEEYVASTQGVSPTTTAVATTPVPERVTRSKKVYCHCQKPDDGEVMIQCDHCRQWFHGACVDITDEIAEMMDLKNEKYFCDPCTEKLKERAKTQHGGKTSKQTKISDARDCALPTCLNEARATDDYCSEECAIKGIELAASQAAHSKTSKPSSIVIPSRKTTVDTSVKKANHPVQPPKSPVSPKAEQDPIRSTALKGITDSLMVAVGSDSTPKEQEEEAAEKAKFLALSIEKELYLFTATPGQAGCGKDYKAKYRSLFFNLKDKNNDNLRARVLSGELKPEELVRLTPEELANPELQSIAEEVRKRSIHDSVLQIEQEPFIKKTHKGEVSFVPRPASLTGSKLEVEEDEEENQRMDDKTEGEKVADGLLLKANGTQDGSNRSTPHGSPKAEVETLDMLLARIQTNKRSGEETLSEALSSDKRQRTMDISEKGGSASLSYLPREPSPYSPSPSPIGSPVLLSTTPPDSPPPFMLEEIRRNMEREQASKSSSNIRDPDVLLPVWQGKLSMHEVAKFQARAVQVGGRTILGRPSKGPGTDMVASGWTDILTRAISIDGRIPTAAVESYLEQVKQSSTKEVVVLRFDAEKAMEGTEDPVGEFESLFKYFHDKNRNGVVPQKGRQVKDMYLVPVAASAPLPRYLRGLIMENDSVVRGGDKSTKNALLGVLVLNKGASYSGSHPQHQHRGHHHPQQHGHSSPSQHKSASAQLHRPTSVGAAASAARPYPVPQERRDSRDSQQGRGAPPQPPAHPGPPPPAPPSAYRPPALSLSTSSGMGPAGAGANAGPKSPPLKVPTLQELQGLVNQLFPSNNPTTSAASVPTPVQHNAHPQVHSPVVNHQQPTSQGPTAAAASVSAQLAAVMPASLTMDLTQTLAQMNQHQQQQAQQHQQERHQQQQPQPPIHPPFFGLHGPIPPGFPLPPPQLVAAAMATGQPLPPIPRFPPMAPEQLHAFMAAQQQQQQRSPQPGPPAHSLPTYSGQQPSAYQQQQHHQQYHYPPTTAQQNHPRDPRQQARDPRDPRHQEQKRDRRWDQ
ncbi:PHD finger protein 3 [Gryganskiella cystojenkinii]|nr:PHD finger protein 3 [Gryganskiella cystojenkinii]